MSGLPAGRHHLVNILPWPPALRTQLRGRLYQACACIRHLPFALTSGGVSTSFSFRDDNPVREAIHSVFLATPSRTADHGHRQRRQLEIYDLELCAMRSKTWCSTATADARDCR
jgi:hypothetical protein